MEPQGMLVSIAATMQQRTGRTLEEWVALVEAAGVEKGFAQATHWLQLPAHTDPAAVAARVEPLAREAYAQNG